MGQNNITELSDVYSNFYESKIHNIVSGIDQRIRIFVVFYRGLGYDKLVLHTPN